MTEQGTLVDLGGVVFLSDWKSPISALKHYSRHPVWRDESAQTVRNALMYSGIIHRFDDGKLTGLEFYKAILEFFAINQAKISYRDFRSIWASVNKLNKPLVDVLRRLKEQKQPRMVIASNIQELFWESIVKRFPQVVALFDTFVLSYSVGASKPDPRFYHECSLRLGLEMTSLSFLDDREENGNAFARLGGLFIKYTWDRHEEAVKALARAYELDPRDLEKDVVNFDC